MNGFGLHSTEVQPENEMPVINTGLILLDQVNQIAWCAKKQLVAFLKLVHFVMNVTFWALAPRKPRLFRAW